MDTSVSSHYTAAMNDALQDEKPALASGKRRLIDAGLRLAASQGVGLSSIGLRELAREAGLNHNTFYRHFGDMEDLARTAVEDVVEQMMAGIKEVRRNAARHADATQGTVAYFLDFVEHHPELFTVGVRELHGGSPAMRRILRQAVDDIAAESVEQIASMDLAPGLSRETLLQTTSAITYAMLYHALIYLDHPEQRSLIAAQLVSVIRMLFFGAAAVQAGSATMAASAATPAAP